MPWGARRSRSLRADSKPARASRNDRLRSAPVRLLTERSVSCDTVQYRMIIGREEQAMCRSRHSEETHREPRDRTVRASDADRERTADHLREQAGEGRLEPDELEQRLERAFTARTLADLDALTADLPRRRSPRVRHSSP